MFLSCRQRRALLVDLGGLPEVFGDALVADRLEAGPFLTSSSTCSGGGAGRFLENDSSRLPSLVAAAAAAATERGDLKREEEEVALSFAKLALPRSLLLCGTRGELLRNEEGLNVDLVDLA
ncbi:hypothetical protein GUITHDRAFT_150595, partial [Guillardia theta CCMP2712]